MTPRAIHRFLIRAGISLAHVFVWVAAFDITLAYTESLGTAFATVALTYALMHTIAVLATPLAAANMRHGSRRTLEAAILCASAAFAALGCLYLTDLVPFAWGMGGFAILMGLYRALYYVPYEILRGGSMRVPFAEIMIALLPAAAGVIVGADMHVPESLYFAAAALIALSLIPMYYMRDRHEGFAWKYRETFHQLLGTEHRTLLLTAICEGIEAAALLLVWPIAAWLILGGSYPLLGFVISATLLITMIVRIVMRQFKTQPTPAISGAWLVSGWVLRFLAGSATGVILVDVYAHAGHDPERRGLDMATHEHAADNHTYVDEYTALKEMGHGIGRIMLCLILALIALSSSLPIILGGVFVLAAGAGVLGMRVARSHARAAY
jgi:hypothetical protein